MGVAGFGKGTLASPVTVDKRKLRIASTGVTGSSAAELVGPFVYCILCRLHVCPMRALLPGTNLGTQVELPKIEDGAYECNDRARCGDQSTWFLGPDVQTYLQQRGNPEWDW